MPIETFVETPRRTRAVYKSGGRILVRTTRGRGRYGRQEQYDKLWKKRLASGPCETIGDARSIAKNHWPLPT